MSVYDEDYTNSLSEARRSIDETEHRLDEALKEIKLRKQYESFLKSVIRSRESLSYSQTFEWFCARMEK